MNKHRKYIYKVRMSDGTIVSRTAKFPQKIGTIYSDGSVCIFSQR